jgi:2-(1,2-epoxy-1,2-dihydrophenyl)acetyl-CoA isomerase
MASNSIAATAAAASRPGDLVVAAESASSMAPRRSRPRRTARRLLPAASDRPAPGQELYFTNRVLTAREALEWGLVTRVVPDAELRPAVAALAAELAQGPTKAYGAAKRLLHQSTWESLETQMELEAQAIAAAGHTEDFRAGVTAFAQKGTPTFRGR